ncbi:hypothetical protein PINS_up005554 [Pythium insidiosum]|nr:hypothetical protein PINS_up005554 [Pythium insidiosum]
MRHSTCSPLVWIVLLSELLACIHGIRFGATTLAILGTPANAAACLGIQIAPKLILTSASCMLTKRPVTYVRFMSSTVWATTELELELHHGHGATPPPSDTFQARLRLTEPEIVEKTHFSPLKKGLLAVVQLRDPRREPENSRLAILPRLLLPPKLDRRRDGVALVIVDPVALHISVMQRVVFMDTEFCGQRVVNQSLTEVSTVCAVPLVNDSTRGIVSVDTASRWSFLVQRVEKSSDDSVSSQDALLGFGDGSTLWYGMFRAFSWISPEISQWLNATAFPGVQLRRLD